MKFVDVLGMGRRETIFDRLVLFIALCFCVFLLRNVVGNWSVDDAYVVFGSGRDGVFRASVAPLVPFLIFVAHRFLRLDAAWFGTALCVVAYVALVISTFIVVRTWSDRVGSSLAAFTVASSPFVLPIAVHDSIVAYALLGIGGACALRGRPLFGVAFVGLSALARPECAVVGLVLVFCCSRVFGPRFGLWSACVGLGPFVAWFIWAGPVIFSDLSRAPVFAPSVIPKFSQFGLLFGVLPYVTEAVGYGIALAVGLQALLFACSACGFAINGRTPPQAATAIIVAFFLCFGVLVACGTSFAPWLCLPLGLLGAVCVSGPWVRNVESNIGLTVVRSLSVLAVAGNLVFAIPFSTNPFNDLGFLDYYPSSDARHGPSVVAASWISHHSSASAIVASVDPASLGYRSHRRVVSLRPRGGDDLVVVIAEVQALGIRAARPRYVVVDTTYGNGFDRSPALRWFGRAYVLRARLSSSRVSRYAWQSRIYELRYPRLVPKVR